MGLFGWHFGDRGRWVVGFAGREQVDGFVEDGRAVGLTDAAAEGELADLFADVFESDAAGDELAGGDAGDDHLASCVAGEASEDVEGLASVCGVGDGEGDDGVDGAGSLAGFRDDGGVEGNAFQTTKYFLARME